MSNKQPSIGEKVRFWEEQDKINNALIPRFLADHKLIVSLSQEVVKISAELSELNADIKLSQENSKTLSANLEKNTTDLIKLVNAQQESEKRLAELNNFLNDLVSKNGFSSLKSSYLLSLVPYLAIVLSIIAIIISVI